MDGVGQSALGSVLSVIFQVVQDVPVAVAPAVDGLLHIAYNQTVCTLGQSFVEQQAEVVPLHAAGVLELVNHDVVQGGAHLFVDERGVACSGQAMEQGGGVGQQEAVLFGIEGVHLVGQAVKQLQGTQVLQGEAAAVHLLLHLLASFFSLLQQGHQLLFGQLDNLVATFRGLDHPLRGFGQAVVHRGVGYVAQGTFAYLAEIASYTSSASFQVAHA